MFDRLFEKRHTVARLQNGPLAEERLRYLAHLAKQQMSRLTLRAIAMYTVVVAKTLSLADRPRVLITRSEIEATAKHWAQRRSRSPGMRFSLHARKAFKGHAIRWLAFLGRLQPEAVVEQPYANRVARFSEYQLRERGLSPNTVAYERRTIHQFLNECADAGLPLKGLTVVQVDQMLSKRVREQGYARSTVSRLSQVLRGFFRFAERRGWCRCGLAVGIMAPRVFRQEGLPTSPSWGDVKRLLAATEGEQPVHIRNRALLMLLAVYGLRAGEVTALRLEDFDWEREMLHVPHSKSQRPRSYPLCRSVGNAILRYVRQVRPRTDRREAFLTLVAPFRPVTTSALGILVRRHLRALGLVLPHYGPHVLRHACATHLLGQGLSLKEIGDHLGHRSPDSTRIYAKVDLVALRCVADFRLEDLL